VAGRAAGAAVLLLTCLLLGSCGSASEADLRTTAAESAEAMVSELRTARMAAETVLAEKTWSSYTRVVLLDAEEQAGTIEESFTTLQPDTAEAQRFQEEVAGLLGDASEVLQKARAAMGRHGLAALRGLLDPLDQVAADLEDLEERLR